MARLAGHETPSRDTQIGEAIAYVCYREWGHSFLDAAGGAPPIGAPEALKQFNQAAADGHVQVWGKQTFSDIYEPIDSEYWRSYQIEWFGLLRGRTTTEPAVIGVKRGSEYAELMTSKSQVEAIWPSPRRKLQERANDFLDVLQRPIPKLLLGLWGVIATWDTFVSQFNVLPVIGDLIYHQSVPEFVFASHPRNEEARN